MQQIGHSIYQVVWVDENPQLAALHERIDHTFRFLEWLYRQNSDQATYMSWVWEPKLNELCSRYLDLEQSLVS